MLHIGAMIALLASGLVIEAHAYVDPGSGSIFIQALIGALAGAAMAAKIYWHRIREKIRVARKND